MFDLIGEYLTGLFGIGEGTKLFGVVSYFIADILKIYAMLLTIIFAVSFIRSYFPPEKVKKYLSHQYEYVGNVLAAVLGIFTPFCSCSAVPVFIGFIESGVPLGVTFSFLISSPMVNEVAVVLLFGLFGWKIAGLYLGTGLLVAIAGGIVIGRLHLEKEVEEYVYQIKMGETELAVPTGRERAIAAWENTKSIFKRVWPYVMIGVGIGAFIHGYAPVGFMAKYAGRDNPLAVPLAVAIGVPLYSNAAGTIPIVKALLEKGLPMGTALAFMMSIVAISLPELIILRQVLKPKLIAIFVATVGTSIVLMGYLFNAVL